MTTLLTNAGFNHTTTAQQQAWVTEVGQAMLTIGLTQTADTGQMAIPCTTVFGGGTNIVYGYYVFRFNDALQGTSPVYIKLSFGNAGAPSAPLMNIQIGTNTNGAGGLTGTVSTALNCFCGSSIGGVGGVNSFIFPSRFCYVAAQGALWVGYKYGGAIGPTYYYLTFGGFAVYRSVGSSGAPTGDCVHLMGNSFTGGSTTVGYMALINYNTSTASFNNSPLYTSGQWCHVPFNTTQTTGISGVPTPQCFPFYQYRGSASLSEYGITNVGALALLPEFSYGATTAYTMLGSLSLTYISAGSLLGLGPGNSLTSALYPTATYTMMMIWQ